jgi:hypothetical protein
MDINDGIMYQDLDDTPTRIARVTIDDFDSFEDAFDYSSMDIADLLECPQIGGGRRREITPDQITPTRLRTTINASSRAQDSTIIDNARIRRARMASIEGCRSPIGVVDGTRSKPRYPTQLDGPSSFDGRGLEAPAGLSVTHGHRHASPQDLSFGGRYLTPSEVGDGQHYIDPSLAPNPLNLLYNQRGSYADHSRSTTRSSVDTQYTHDNRPSSANLQDADDQRHRPPSIHSLVQQSENLQSPIQPPEERSDIGSRKFLQKFLMKVAPDTWPSDFQPSTTVRSASRTSPTICSTSRTSTTVCSAS